MKIVKVLDTFENLLKFICTLFMSAIVAILSYAVVMRYVFHMPPGWSMELSRYIFLWMVMLCAVLVTRERTHIQMSYLVGLLPGKVRFVWLTVVRLLMIGFCWVMIQYGLKILPIVAEAKSPTLEISMGYMYLSIPVGGLLIGLYLTEIIVRSFYNKEWVNHSEVEIKTC
ncbi:MAG: TRAP transporter small permease [Desulfobacteraceae bacterium]|jgi:TRAP-type C4-dicarboxylate transport system permease small subunit